MRDIIVGRKEEQMILEQFLTSAKPEFLAIYGRRRVGKTHLIRHFFQYKRNIFFDVAGTKNSSLAAQLANFMERIGDIFYHGATLEKAKSWRDAFKKLTDAIKTVNTQKQIVLFFDEFPWMATKNSRLLQTLDYFWNQVWSKNSKIKLIICGSSASWIIKNIINNKGGLHNRVTYEVHLEPYNLKETKQFLWKNGVKLNNKQITEIYMAIGGIPYYLSQIETGLSATQIIERLAFRKKSFLLNEFDKLFSSLFDDAEIYINIIKNIAKYRYGISQEILVAKTPGLSRGGSATQKLQALEDTGFILKFKPFLHKEKGIYYKIIDEYTLFYFDWIAPMKEKLQRKALREGYWEDTKTSTAWASWSGYAFEAVCYKHLVQISKALKLRPTAVAECWRHLPKKNSAEKGAQIDLLFDRHDHSITLCEIKYSATPFAINKQYAQNLLNKIDVFKLRTKVDKQIFLAMISACGLKKTLYSEELVDNVVVLDDLFKDEN